MPNKMRRPKGDIWNIVFVSILIIGGISCSNNKDTTSEDPINIVSKGFKKGDTMVEMLTTEGLSTQLALQLSQKFQKESGVRYVKPGDSLRLVWRDGKLERIEYYKLPWERYILSLKDGVYTLKRVNYPLLKRVELLKGTVTSSLYESLLDMGESPTLIEDYANILSWDIDFSVETRNGDTFSLVVEKYYWGDRFVRYGRILFLYYSGEETGRKEGYRFELPDGIVGYYDEEGNSLRKAFLRSPLSYTRITSRFTKRRFHPILRVWRPHHGVDYAAPVGTAISSIGDGTVTYAGWKGGYGKYVRIKHKNGYESGYGHLSRIRKGIYKGKRVRQGDIIGYVGSTGLSTGPNLHFEVYHYGKFINPLRLKPFSTKPLSKEYISLFKEEISRMKKWEDSPHRSIKTEDSS